MRIEPALPECLFRNFNTLAKCEARGCSFPRRVRVRKRRKRCVSAIATTAC